MTGLAATAVILGELAALLSVLAVFLGVQWRRAHKRGAELRARLEHGHRESGGYLAQIHAAVQSVIAAHRGRFGGGAEILHTGKLLKAPEAPDQVAMQLRYEFLRQEQKLLEDLVGRQDYWTRRALAAGEVLTSLVAGEEGLRHWWAGQQRKFAELADRQRREHAEAITTFNLKLQRSEFGLAQAKQRAEELEAYRGRFNMLHHEVLREREANEVLRRRLREKAANLVEQPLLDYQRERDSLDNFLDRADIVPFAGRHVEPPAGPSPLLRARRQRQVLMGSNRRLGSGQQALGQALEQQRTLIQRLQLEVEQSGEREERLKTYYQHKVRELQKSLDLSRQSADELEKEIIRSRRAGAKLIELSEHREQEMSSNAALEQTIDRFATQAIDMQQRIQTLEQELAQSNSDNLNLQARLEASREAAASAAPPTVNN